MNSAVDNKQRAQWAEKAVKAFQKEVKTDDHDALSDLLCDLMHWANQNNVNFDNELERGRTHYESELGDELDQAEGP